MQNNKMQAKDSLQTQNRNDIQGILLVNKPSGKSSFSLVHALRKIFGVKKIGHAGTLDPFATGVMVMLVGRQVTRKSDQFLSASKEYRARIQLGVESDTFDCDGVIQHCSSKVPTIAEIEEVVGRFQGELEQIPPMFSAKKIKGKKLYELAREGKTVERQPVKIHLNTTILQYNYPFLDLHIACSKGTYIRSIADDMGKMLGTGGLLVSLERTRSGNFCLEQCVDGTQLYSLECSKEYLHSRLIRDEQKQDNLTG